MGTLHGLKNIRPGRALELRPYVLGGVDRAVELDETSARQEIGADAKWGVTTGMTADFTVNTDFAQEEADVQQINLTRFSLFFPEKRQIFLESERSFIFGVKREADLVFTRRIGLSSSGGIIPILGGARRSGRQGRYNLGIMNMQTDDVLAGTVAAENFTVMRLRRDLFERSNVGVVFTNRQGGGSYNRVYGADLNLFLGQAWSFESYFAAVDEDEPETSGAAQSGFAKLEYRRTATAPFIAISVSTRISTQESGSSGARTAIRTGAFYASAQDPRWRSYGSSISPARSITSPISKGFSRPNGGRASSERCSSPVMPSRFATWTPTSSWTKGSACARRRHQPGKLLVRYHDGPIGYVWPTPRPSAHRLHDRRFLGWHA